MDTDKQLIEAIHSRRGNQDGLSRLLTCYDIWSASPATVAAGCVSAAPEAPAS